MRTSIASEPPEHKIAGVMPAGRAGDPAGLTLGLVVSGLSLVVALGLVLAERSNDLWTRLALKPADRVVADERDYDSQQDGPQNDSRQVRPP